MKFDMTGALAIIFFSILFTCSNDFDDTTCNTSDPVNELVWLKRIAEDIEAGTDNISPYFYIRQGIYRSRTIFFVDNCCAACNTAIYLLNCEGDLIGQLNGDIQREEIKNSKIIFKRGDFSCE